MPAPRLSGSDVSAAIRFSLMVTAEHRRVPLPTSIPTAVEVATIRTLSESVTRALAGHLQEPETAMPASAKLTISNPETVAVLEEMVSTSLPAGSRDPSSVIPMDIPAASWARRCMLPESSSRRVGVMVPPLRAGSKMIVVGVDMALARFN